MKITLLTIMTALAFASAPAFAQAPADHSQHDSSVPNAAGTKHDMGKMHMEHMQGMMKDCMQTKKDDKMCDRDTMKMCQSKMNKVDCKEMMKKAKAHGGPAKT